MRLSSLSGPKMVQRVLHRSLSFFNLVCPLTLLPIALTDMNSGILELALEEVQSNFDFCLTLVERGHTIKITQQGKPSVLMVPLPDYQKAVETIETANHPPLPLPEGWQPDPAGVKQYVNEELTEMQKELNT